MFRLPSPSLVISLLALTIALGGAGYSATGGNFILGQANSAQTQTKLVTPLAGAAFRVDNTSTAANATGMTIVTNGARPPLAVTSSAKVANFNADRLDGLSSEHFPSTFVFAFNLAPFATSNPIPVARLRPVFMMGATNTNGFEAAGQVTLIFDEDSNIISWSGIEACCAAAATPVITQGSANPAVPGTHIVFIDDEAKVEIETFNDTGVKVRNGSASQKAGRVTMVW